MINWSNGGDAGVRVQAAGESFLVFDLGFNLIRHQMKQRR